MAYYIYMAGCADGSIYTGIAADPCRRLRQHGDKTGARYTRSHPVTALLGLWCTQDRPCALRMEAAVKKLPRSRKELLLSEPDKLPQLLPGLAAELYQYIPGVTLERCLKGDWNHHA